MIKIWKFQFWLIKNCSNIEGKIFPSHLFQKWGIYLYRTPFIVKMGSRSENWNFLDFSNFYWRDLSKTQLIRKWKWHFPLQWEAKLANLNWPLLRFQWPLANSAFVLGLKPFWNLTCLGLFLGISMFSYEVCACRGRALMMIGWLAFTQKPGYHETSSSAQHWRKVQILKSWFSFSPMMCTSKHLNQQHSLTTESV